MAPVECSLTSNITLKLAIAVHLITGIEMKLIIFQLQLSPLGGAIVLQEDKKAWLERKFYLCFYFHLASGLCSCRSKFILGNIGVSVMSLLLVALFITNNSTKQSLFNGGCLCLTQCMVKYYII